MVVAVTAVTSTSIWTLETIVRNFDTIPGRLDQGKWLVVTAKISPVFRSLGSSLSEKCWAVLI
jgi:hypothetical protein